MVKYITFNQKKKSFPFILLDFIFDSDIMDAKVLKECTEVDRTVLGKEKTCIDLQQIV